MKIGGVINLLASLASLVEYAIRSIREARIQKQNDKIRKDPVGWFNDTFSGVPDNKDHTADTNQNTGRKD